MKIILRSVVKGHFQEVYNAFDEQLFRYLLPNYPKTELLKFTGSSKGDIVHLRMHVLGGQEWISDITEDACSAEECYFVDEGRQLPFPLRFWRHKHRVVRKSKMKSIIIDEIEFSAGLGPLDFLIYPFLYIAFYPRKQAYKKYFDQYE